MLNHRELIAKLGRGNRSWCSELWFCRAGAKPLRRRQQQGGDAPSPHLPPVPCRSSASKQNQAREGGHLPPCSHLRHLPACPYTGHAVTRASSCADRGCADLSLSQGVGNTVTHLEVVLQLQRCRALLHGAQTNLCVRLSAPLQVAQIPRLPHQGEGTATRTAAHPTNTAALDHRVGLGSPHDVLSGGSTVKMACTSSDWAFYS